MQKSDALGQHLRLRINNNEAARVTARPPSSGPRRPAGAAGGGRRSQRRALTDARNQIVQGRERGRRTTSIEDGGLQGRGRQLDHDHDRQLLARRRTRSDESIKRGSGGNKRAGAEGGNAGSLVTCVRGSMNGPRNEQKRDPAGGGGTSGGCSGLPRRIRAVGRGQLLGGYSCLAVDEFDMARRGRSRS